MPFVKSKIELNGLHASTKPNTSDSSSTFSPTLTKGIKTSRRIEDSDNVDDTVFEVSADTREGRLHLAPSPGSVSKSDYPTLFAIEDEMSTCQSSGKKRSAAPVPLTSSRPKRHYQIHTIVTDDGDGDVALNDTASRSKSVWDKLHEEFVIKMYETYGLDTTLRPVYIKRCHNDVMKTEMSELRLTREEEPPLKRRRIMRMDIDSVGKASVRTGGDDAQPSLDTKFPYTSPPSSSLIIPFKPVISSSSDGKRSQILRSHVIKSPTDPRRDRYVATNTPFANFSALESSLSIPQKPKKAIEKLPHNSAILQNAADEFLTSERSLRKNISHNIPTSLELDNSKDVTLSIKDNLTTVKDRRNSSSSVDESNEDSWGQRPLSTKSTAHSNLTKAKV